MFLTRWSTTLKLLPDIPNEITENVGHSYNCALGTSIKLPELQEKFNDIEQKIKDCLTNHERREYTESTVSVYEKKDFVRKVAFIPKDKAPNGLLGVEGSVTLQLEKSGTDKYSMKVRIE
mgnify:CR=1 FL=1